MSLSASTSIGSSLRASLRTTAKRGLALAVGQSGLESLVWKSVLSDRLLILCYHSVIPDDACSSRIQLDDSAVSVSEFKRHLELVLKRYRPCSLDDLLASVESGRSSNTPRVLITFDDGFRNNYDHAAPILQRLGVPAIFSVTTGYIGGSRILWPNELVRRIFYWPEPDVPLPGIPGAPVQLYRLPDNTAARVAAADRIREGCKKLSHQAAGEYLQLLRSKPSLMDEYEDPELNAFMSWENVRSLAHQGFSIASHTVDHPILTRISSEDAGRELRESKSRIEKELGIECPCFVYPNGCAGSYSAELMNQCQRAGYRIALTLTNQFPVLSRSPFALSRVYVPGQVPDGSFQFRTSSVYGLLQRLR